MNEPKILVTGGSGLLGSYLLRWFLHHGYKNLTGTYHLSENIPADLQDKVAWRSLVLPDITDAFDIIEGHDWVIHAAGMVSYNHEDRFLLLDINTKGTKIIVDACLAANVQHLIYISSIAALGKEKNHVTLNESSAWIENDYSTPYGLSKYLGELEAWRGAAEVLNVSCILPAIILGTGNWKSSSLQLIDRVANRLPWYPGGMTGYVDVRDIADFIGLLLEKNISGNRWILNGSNMTYKDIYDLIAAKLNLKKKFSEAPEWMARTVLFLTNATKGRFSVPDLVHQVYGSFTYDASKSLSVDGFKYRNIDQTIREVVEIFQIKDPSKTLSFEK